MLFASNRGVGMSIGFPDVCLTPAAPAPLPIPYPNFAFNIMASPFALTVFITFMPGLHMLSKILMSMGDEGGVAHPTFKGTGSYTMGNLFVFIDFMPAINLCCLTTGNNYNNPIGGVLVPSVTNVFFACNLPEFSEAPSAAGARTLGQVARGDGALEEPIRAQRLDDGVVLLTLRTMPSNVSTLVYQQLSRVGFQNTRALIIDLRGNPGGDAKAALDLADDFLPEGVPLALMQYPDGDVTPIKSRHQDPYRWPLTMLVDEDTASAAELFAGCLQQHTRAQLVGQITFGKAQAHEMVRGPDGPTYMKMATFSLPDGTAIDGVGLTPDHAIDTGTDPLAHALRLHDA